MSILSIQTGAPTGLVGVVPQIIYVETNDTQDTILTPGYLDSARNLGENFNQEQIACISTSDNPVAFYNLTINSSTRVITLSPQGGSGEVLLPVVVNHIATYTTIDGQIGDVAATAIHGGSIQAGLPGTAGSLFAYPSGGGRIAITPTTCDGDFSFILSNDAHIEFDTTASIPFSGYPSYRFLVSDYMGEQFVEHGNFSLVDGDLTLYQGHFLKLKSPTTNQGTLLIHAANSADDRQIVLTNHPFLQNTTFFLPDPGTVNTSFILTTCNISPQEQQILGGDLKLVDGTFHAGDPLVPGFGGFTSYAGTIGGGNLRFYATPNMSGDHTVTVTNDTNMDQDSIYRIPNTSFAENAIIVAPGTTPFTPRNMVRASAGIGARGVLEDAGAAFFSGSSSSGGGSPSLVFNVIDSTVGSKIQVTTATYTNLAFIINSVPGAGTLTVNFSADPGAVSIYYMGTTDTITFPEELIMKTMLENEYLSKQLKDSPIKIGLSKKKIPLWRKIVKKIFRVL